MKRLLRTFTSRSALPITFYRRELPKELIAFDSKLGKLHFKDSLQSGNAELFFPLAGNMMAQNETAYCGLTSLCMVLNALSLDPKKTWKGVWRWFGEEVLECASLESIKSKGATFDQIHQIALCNGLSVNAKRYDQTTFDEFMEDIKRVTSQSDPKEHLVVSFSRKSLGQTGDGHFSPIAAYAPSFDSVLVLDTARFKYPSYFVASRDLYLAMQPADQVTGLPRGYLLLSPKSSLEKAIPLCRLDISKPSLEALRSFFISSTSSITVREVLSKIFSEKPFVFVHSDKGKDLAGTGTENADIQNDLLVEIAKLRKEVQSTEIYRKMEAHEHIPESQKISVALLILSLPSQLFQNLSNADRATFLNLQEISSANSLLREEVTLLRSRLSDFLNHHCHKSECASCL